MHTFKAALFLSITLLALAGCAGKQDKMQAQLSAQQQQIKALMQMNAALRDSAGGERSALPAQQAQTEAVAYAAAPAPMGGISAPMAAVLTVRDQQEAMMPSNNAWLRKPPANICSAAMLLELTNESQYHWELALNGKDVLIEGRPFVFAPKQKIWFCLPDTEEQELVGIAYLGRAGMLQAVEGKTFVFQDSFGSWFNPNIGHQKAAISDQTPTFNQLRIYS